MKKIFKKFEAKFGCKLWLVLVLGILDLILLLALIGLFVSNSDKIFESANNVKALLGTLDSLPSQNLNYSNINDLEKLNATLSTAENLQKANVYFFLIILKILFIFSILVALVKAIQFYILGKNVAAHMHDSYSSDKKAEGSVKHRNKFLTFIKLFGYFFLANIMLILFSAFFLDVMSILTSRLGVLGSSAMIFSFILWFIVYTYVFMLLYALAGKRLVCDKFRFIQFIKTHTGFLSLFLVYVVIAFFIMSALYYFVISQYVSWASIAIFGIGGVLVVIMYSIILVEHVYLMKAE